MGKSITKTQINRLDKLIEALDKKHQEERAELVRQRDLKLVEKRMNSVMNAMISSEGVKDVLVNERFTNSVIETVLSNLMSSDNIVQYIENGCESEYTKSLQIDHQKSVKKSSAKPKTVSSDSEKTTADINTDQTTLSEGSQGNQSV